MSKNDLLDDIDYSTLHAESPVAEPAKSKIADRQFKKDSPKAQAKDIDVEALKAQTAQVKQLAGTPELPPSNLDYVIPGLGVLAGLYLLHQNLKSKDLPSSPKQDMRLGPVAPVTPPDTPLPSGLSPQEFNALSPEDKALVIRGGQNTIAKQTAQQELAQQVNKLQTELASIPQSANPVPVPKEIQNTFDAHNALMTGTGRPVVEGQGKSDRFYKVYQSPTDVPKGYAWVPNAQYADVLRNDIGQETYTKTYTGKEFPSTYAEAQAQVQEVNRGLNRPTHAEMKAKGIVPPEPEKGIFRKVGTNKLVKVGGVAGALVAISDLAKAETAEQKATAGTNLLGSLLPPGADINEAGAPTLGEKQIQQQENMLKLGSPYGLTEEAKKARLKEKSGAGRGIAPPSAYMR